MSTGRLFCTALVVAVLVAPAASGGAERPPEGAREPRPAPRQVGPGGLKGACYLTFAERQECTADTTEAECRQRCDDQLCDSYTWRDRLPCWNWGYGG